MTGYRKLTVTHITHELEDRLNLYFTNYTRLFTAARKGIWS